MNTVPVTCTCGNTFAANAQLSGKQVNCPACGQLATVLVPGIALVCPCGSQFKANPAMVGQQVNCPNCGQAVHVAARPAQPILKKKTRSQRENDAQVVAVLGYLTVIGLIIAFVLYSQQKRKNSLASFHLRQSAGVYLSSVLMGVLIWPATYVVTLLGVVGFQIWLVLVGLISLVLGIAWFYGLLCAILRSEDPVPIVGDLFQDLFAFIE